MLWLWSPTWMQVQGFWHNVKCTDLTSSNGLRPDQAGPT